MRCMRCGSGKNSIFLFSVHDTPELFLISKLHIVYTSNEVKMLRKHVVAKSGKSF